MSVNEKMTAIADAVRDKTGGTEALTLDDMASGVGEVYEAGKQSEYDRFWDEYQNKGKQMNWGAYAFAGLWWNNMTFNPKYDIITGKGDASGYFMINGVTNLRDKIDRRGLKLDLTRGTTVIGSFFRQSQSVESPDFDSGNCTRMVDVFYEATKMHTIPRFNMTSCTNANNAFYKASALRNITFEGTIPVSISFSYSPLTVESMKSIITHLKNYAGTDKEFTCKVTFSSACLTALEAEGATSPNGNNWLDYMTDLGWNH